MTAEKTCIVCQKLFTPTRANQKYCSSSCIKIGSNYVTLTCQKCGQLYKKREVAAHRSKYCSKKCQTNSIKVTTTYTKTCKCCKNIFYTTNDRQHYCSTPCKDKHQRKRGLSGKAKECKTCIYCKNIFEDYIYRKTKYCSNACKHKHISDKGKVTRICKQCGNTYLVIKSQVILRGSNFCSRECQGLYKSIKITGQNNPNYIHGKGDKYSNDPHWGRIRRQVLKRDNYVCQICNNPHTHKNRLHIHHVVPLRHLLPNYTVANHKSNLITLCRSCHGKIEAQTRKLLINNVGVPLTSIAHTIFTTLLCRPYPTDFPSI